MRSFQQQPETWTDPLTVTQLLRGTHYIYIDFLLGTIFEEAADLERVVIYLQNHLDLTRQYLAALDTSFEKYYRSQENKNESIVVDRESAWVCSFYELLDACVSIFGGYARLQPFYKDNRVLLADLLEHDREAPDLLAD